jgi:subtilisin family serine protease
MRWNALAVLTALLVVGRVGWAQSAAGGPGPVNPPVRTAVPHLANPREIRERLGLTRDFGGIAGIESIKVAVLDYGFEGVGDGRPFLPAGAVVVEHYDPEFVRRNGLGDPEFRKPFEPGNRHGRIMAQLVWAVTGSYPGGPKFYLLNAGGPTMLRRAVRYAIEQKVDVILFSGSFEGGGFGDGRGPVDRIVADASAAGILWVNAAGNYGRRIYNGPVRILGDGYLRLRDGSDVASLRFRNHVDDNTVSITLTWDDYRDEEDAGTDKDLDLFVEDWAGRRVGSGEKVQVSGAKAAGPEESRNPRERVVLTGLPASPGIVADPDYCYRIRIRARRGRFTATDRIRVLVTSARETYWTPGGDAPREALDFLDASNSRELYPPADSPLVLTVGDSDPTTSIGPTLDGRVKPEVVLDDARAFFTDGEILAGSSTASAYVAGAVVLLKAAAPSLQPRHLLRLARLGPAVSTSAPRVAGRPSRTTGLRFWQTPSRARLAEVLLDDR